jgi:hypothetical protein
MTIPIQVEEMDEEEDTVVDMAVAVVEGAAGVVDMSVSHGTINNRIDIKDGSNTPM